MDPNSRWRVSPDRRFISARAALCVVVTFAALALLGDTGARLGGARRLHGTLRVLGWGAVAMAVTAGIGALVGTTTG
jgi:VIT1/CCC1 family predicted Fe2+/Mn2+ transporter